MARGRPRVGHSSYTDVSPLMNNALAMRPEQLPIQIRCASESVAIRSIHRMNQYRILCRQENPELKSVYDPYVFRRKGDWLEIDIRGRLDILQMFDGQGNPLNIDTMQARAPTPEEAQTLIDKSEKAPITPEIQAQLDIVKRDFDEYQDMLKHGPHRLDPDKPLIDDEEPTNAES